MKKLTLILLVFLIFTLAGCKGSDNVVDRREVVCDIDESEIPTVEKEVVVTETEIVYVDRPLGVSDEELNFYIWYTFEVFKDIEEDEDAYIKIHEDDMTIEVHNGSETHRMTMEEYLAELYDYYDYVGSWD